MMRAEVFSVVGLAVALYVVPPVAREERLAEERLVRAEVGVEAAALLADVEQLQHRRGIHSWIAKRTRLREILVQVQQIRYRPRNEAYSTAEPLPFIYHLFPRFGRINKNKRAMAQLNWRAARAVYYRVIRFI